MGNKLQKHQSLFTVIPYKNIDAMGLYTLNFSEIDYHNVEKVGGKNASLGEMFSRLQSEGIDIPDGFATTAGAYWKFIEENNISDDMNSLLDQLDKTEFSNLHEIGPQLRNKILKGKLPEELKDDILKSYRDLKERDGNISGVAVRSSATAEDLPEASFAGQHDSFMNVRNEEELLETVIRCFASLFTDRAIKYREDHGFEHMKVALSAGIQKMVRSDLGSSGVAFTIDPDTGFNKVVFINASWGLGDNVVGGVVQGDQFYLYKKNLELNKKAILSKELGTKEKTMVYTDKGAKDQTKNIETPQEKRIQFSLNDEDLTLLGKWCTKIEKHYQKAMDIEWAKDGDSGKLYIVQARPETVHSAKKGKNRLVHYSLQSKGEVLVTGSAIGEKIAKGKARILHSPSESHKLQKGEVLVTEITNPDWDPIMKKASAIVTNEGGRTSHAAIVSRELGAVAIVGCGNATQAIKDGQEITVSCAEGQLGKVYKGQVPWDETEVDMDELDKTETQVMLILSDPTSGYKYANYPVDGVGLLRLEFTINNSIKVHPMALVKYHELKDEKVKQKIEALTANYPNKEKYFTEKLSMAVGTIAACFYPNDVIVRMSDFKSNEYANLLGGEPFEPKENNPMVGFRGASRYYHERYKEGFRLECEAMKIVRDEMGFDNVKLMVPFCRTVEEGKKVIDLMASHGLKQGENGLEIYVMTELPVNIFGAEKFAGVFDGFSIGSNDLTQLILGVDRDSHLVSDIFNEKNEQVMMAISHVIKKAKENGKKIGLCGQAPSDFPEYAQFLVNAGIDSISFNADAVLKGIQNIMKAEKKMLAMHDQDGL